MRLPAADAVALLTRAGRDDLLRFATRLAGGDAREYGLQLRSLVEAGQGKITRAMALLDTCSASNHGLAIEAQSRLAALSFIPLDVAEIERIRSEVFAWTPDIHAIEDPIDSVAHVVSYPYLRLHRLGLLSLRLNDTAAVQALAGQLDDMAKATPSNASAQLLAASLRAHLAATRSRPREALALLQGTTASRVTSATSLEAYDRLLYAQLLEQRGRDDEALRFYSHLGSRSPFEFAFVWQAELGMARIHARRGERTMAARYYRRVAERLRDADSTLLNVRDDAERLAASVMPK
jgi:tetratricopeptide (TPR) repeat protein